jgi:hypothetical protein
VISRAVLSRLPTRWCSFTWAAEQSSETSVSAFQSRTRPCLLSRIRRVNISHWRIPWLTPYSSLYLFTDARESGLIPINSSVFHGAIYPTLLIIEFNLRVRCKSEHTSQICIHCFCISVYIAKIHLGAVSQSIYGSTNHARLFASPPTRPTTFNELWITPNSERTPLPSKRKHCVPA